MDRYDQLYEKYEDALFALLLDQVAQDEGARLFEENERLRRDPNAGVPESLDRKSRETIRRAFASQKLSHHSVGWYLNKLAIAVLAALLLFVSAYATLPDLRVRTLDLLIRTSDVSSRLSLTSADIGEASDLIDGLLAGYTLPDIPRDYELVDTGETPLEAWRTYSRADGTTIRIKITSSEDSYIDDEGAFISKEVQIHGYQGKLVAKGDSVYILWHDVDTEKLIYLYTTNINEDMALSYAEQIVYVGR